MDVLLTDTAFLDHKNHTRSPIPPMTTSTCLENPRTLLHTPVVYHAFTPSHRRLFCSLTFCIIHGNSPSLPHPPPPRHPPLQPLIARNIRNLTFIHQLFPFLPRPVPLHSFSSHRLHSLSIPTPPPSRSSSTPAHSAVSAFIPSSSVSSPHDLNW